ncbi:MAG: glycoside hydrolase family 95-like protein [Rhabdochlamydiaceae bacterium]|jgi:hypothetical protein
MKITIAERLHPFSHKNGTKFLLPQTSFSVQLFPTRLYFTDLEGDLESFFLSFDFTGPVSDFTAELDLERGILRLFGTTREGYVSYLIFAKKEGICLKMEKIPREKVTCRRSFSSEPIELSKGESLLIPLPFKAFEQMRMEERLSLGGHKAQDWEMICRRFDFKEIFPLWLSLSHWIPLREEEGKGGNYLLLEKCRQRIDQREKEKVIESFQNLFLSAFDGVLVPRLDDTEYQGILPASEQQNLSHPPLPLLTKGAHLIRSLFFQEKGGKIGILPCLPPAFHCGRMIGVKTSNATIDFEWTKKKLRRMRISPFLDGEIDLNLPKGIRSCRVKQRRYGIEKLASGVLTLPISGGKVIELDRFEQ